MVRNDAATALAQDLAGFPAMDGSPGFVVFLLLQLTYLSENTCQARLTGIATNVDSRIPAAA